MSAVRIIRNMADFADFKKSQRGIIFYSTSWCPCCIKIRPLYDRIAAHYSTRITFAYCDIEKVKLDFSKVPVFVAYHKGEEISHMLGADAHELKSFISKAMHYDEV